MNLVSTGIRVFRSRLAVSMCLASCGLSVPAAAEAGPQPATLAAFQRYVGGIATCDAQRADGRATSLWVHEDAARKARVRAGQIEVGPANGDAPSDVPGGLVHDWIGAAFIPGARVNAVVALVQDYDRHAIVYAPDVVASKLLARDGQQFTVSLRLLRHEVLTVTLDTAHEATYTRVSDTRWCSRSATTSVREVRNAGEPDEVVLPPEDGHGFLWRLDSFWSFEESDGGVYVECRAVSLSRNVPTGLGWLVGPFVRRVPREALARTLEATRNAMK